MRRPPKEITAFKLHGETVTVYEVERVSDLLDTNRSVRPLAIVDGVPRPGENKLRVTITAKNLVLVSKAVGLDAVLAQARQYPGETLLDSVLNVLEHSEQESWRKNE